MGCSIIAAAVEKPENLTAFPKFLKRKTERRITVETVTVTADGHRASESLTCAPNDAHLHLPEEVRWVIRAKFPDDPLQLADGSVEQQAAVYRVDVVDLATTTWPRCRCAAEAAPAPGPARRRRTGQPASTPYSRLVFLSPWSLYDPHEQSSTTVMSRSSTASTSSNAGGNTPPELVRRRGTMTPERKSFLTEVRAALDRYGVEDSGHRHLHKAVDMAPPTTASLRVRVTRPNGTLLASAEERGRQGEAVTLHVQDITEEGRHHPAFAQLDSVPGDITIDLSIFLIRMETEDEWAVVFCDETYIIIPVSDILSGDKEACVRFEMGLTAKEKEEVIPNLIEARIKATIESALVSALKQSDVLAAIVPTIVSAVRESVRASIQDELEKFQEQLLQRERDLKALNTKFTSLQDAYNNLQVKYNDLEQYSRRNCILVSGIPEPPVEGGTDNVGMELATNKLKCDPPITTQDIDRSHRLGKPRNDGKPRPIIVKFVSYRQKSVVMRAKANARAVLTNENLYINDNLTKGNMHLLKDARELVKGKHLNQAWSYDGKIFVKTLNGERQMISKQAELDISRTV
ncbi:hypothetical protein Bbelb_290340 [Branchiostoma belcheri]|nr:hypothetical protein Bbelb_290340 [Branchiostoma belcheri]